MRTRALTNQAQVDRASATVRRGRASWWFRSGIRPYHRHRIRRRRRTAAPGPAARQGQAQNFSAGHQLDHLSGGDASRVTEGGLAGELGGRLRRRERPPRRRRRSRGSSPASRRPRRRSERRAVRPSRRGTDGSTARAPEAVAGRPRRTSTPPASAGSRRARTRRCRGRGTPLMRSATSSWLPTRAVPAPPRTRPM